MGICMGAFAKRPYKHNSKKVIDYQFYRLCQSFGTLTKCSDAKMILRLFG